MVLIVLDEIDKAQNPEIINKIIRTKSEMSGQYPCVICITNELQLREKFPPHLKSTLCENTLIINPYDAFQLRDIVEARIKLAFKPNATSEMVAPLCAAFAAQEHGDARRAIDLLRVSGEIADSLGKCQVEEEDVRTALEKIEIDRVIEVVKKLPTQSKASLLACLYVFESNQECDTNNIYNVYSAICKEALIDSLTQRRMTDLLAELDQLGIIEGTIVFKGRYGRKKQITRIASKDHMLETLYQDFTLKNIKDVPRSTFLKTLTRRW
jgi:cell division control protein 6